MRFHEVLHDVHDFGHLEEDEYLYLRHEHDKPFSNNERKSYPVTRSKELRQDSHKQLKLAGYTPDIVVDHSARADLVLYTIEQKRMLANFPELHKFVAETLNTTIGFAITWRE